MKREKKREKKKRKEEEGKEVPITRRGYEYRPSDRILCSILI